MAGRAGSLSRHRLPRHRLDILVLESRFRRYGWYFEQRLEDSQYGQGILSDYYYVPIKRQLSYFIDALVAGFVARSRDARRTKASLVVCPHISSDGCNLLQTSGRSGLPKSAQRLSLVR